MHLWIEASESFCYPCSQNLFTENGKRRNQENHFNNTFNFEDELITGHGKIIGTLVESTKILKTAPKLVNTPPRRQPPITCTGTSIGGFISRPGQKTLFALRYRRNHTAGAALNFFRDVLKRRSEARWEKLFARCNIYKSAEPKAGAVRATGPRRDEKWSWRARDGVTWRCSEVFAIATGNAMWKRLHCLGASRAWKTLLGHCKGSCDIDVTAPAHTFFSVSKKNRSLCFYCRFQNS